MIRVGDVVEVTGEALAKSGAAVAHVDSRVVHIAGLLPGERADARIVHVGRQRSHAALVAIAKPLAGRRKPLCAHQGHGQDSCSGCPLMVAEEPLQRRLKREALALVGIDVGEVVAGDSSTAYRWSAKRVVAGAAGLIRLGSWRRDSHEIADMDDCQVDHPDIVACAAELKSVATAQGIVPYDEAKGAGDLRYVWLKTDGAGSVLVTLVTADRQTQVHGLAEALTRASGVAWCVQPTEGNAIRSDDVVHLCGVERLSITLAGMTVEVGPLGFLQPNPAVAALAYRALVDHPPGRLALDLYAGAGVTTRLLRERFEAVRACEAYPESALALGVEAMTSERFLQDVVAAEVAPDLIVANPPRAGLGERVCALLDQLAARATCALHVMSCEPRSMARDISRLNHFDLLSAEAFDTLPQTMHVEVVCKLRSKKMTSFA